MDKIKIKVCELVIQVIRFLYIKDGGGVFRFYFTTLNLMKFN